MKRINIVCITLLMILLGVNTSCADYLDKAPDEDLTLDDVFTRENYQSNSYHPFIGICPGN